MSLKDLLIPFTLALLTTWIIQYFFIGQPASQPEEARSGQKFVAPKVHQEQKPLNTEIDFNDNEKPKEAVVTKVETDKARLFFSTHGASLDRIEFKATTDELSHDIQTVWPVGENEKENSCFLVAFQERTMMKNINKLHCSS